MISDIILNRSFYITMEDREKCLSAINQVFKLADLARKEGFNRLEVEVRDKSYSFFLKTGIDLANDGIDSSLIEVILENLIASESYSGTELLERLIFAQGVLLLLEGTAPCYIRKFLFTLLGDTYVQKMRDKETNNDEYVDRYFTLRNSITDKITLPECMEFADYIKSLQDRSIQFILKFIDVNDLICALKGCEKEVIWSITDNMSLNQSIYLLEMLEAEENELVYITKAQKEILDYLINLEKEGSLHLAYK